MPRRDGRSPRHARGRGATAREFLGATAVLLVLLAVFLWEPLTTPDSAYSSDDLLQSSPLVRTVADDYRFGNVMLTDPVLQMHPWLEFNKDALADGNLPVWNPYNGAGAPHLANFVSAVFSPFSVPFYVMPVRAALIASAGLKLLVLGLFTYLFLRRIALSHIAGLVGAAGFMFAAYNVLWVAWPHPGAAVCLPARALLRRGGDAGHQPGAAAAGVVRVRGSGAHGPSWPGIRRRCSSPGAWCWPTSPCACSCRGRSVTGRVRLAKAGQFVIASVLAMGLAAVQLLPFVEYLQRSTAYAEGSERAQAHFELAYSGLHAFPNLFGAPSETYYQPLQLVGGLQLPDGTRLPSNYIESAGFYVGSCCCCSLAVGGVVVVRRPSVGTFGGRLRGRGRGGMGVLRPRSGRDRPHGRGRCPSSS